MGERKGENGGLHYAHLDINRKREVNGGRGLGRKRSLTL